MLNLILYFLPFVIISISMLCKILMNYEIIKKFKISNDKSRFLFFFSLIYFVFFLISFFFQLIFDLLKDNCQEFLKRCCERIKIIYNTFCCKCCYCDYNSCSCCHCCFKYCKCKIINPNILRVKTSDICDIFGYIYYEETLEAVEEEKDNIKDNDIEIEEVKNNNLKDYPNNKKEKTNIYKKHENKNEEEYYSLNDIIK